MIVMSDEFGVCLIRNGVRGLTWGEGILVRFW